MSTKPKMSEEEMMKKYGRKTVANRMISKVHKSYIHTLFFCLTFFSILLFFVVCMCAGQEGVRLCRLHAEEVPYWPGKRRQRHWCRERAAPAATQALCLLPPHPRSKGGQVISRHHTGNRRKLSLKSEKKKCLGSKRVAKIKK